MFLGMRGTEDWHADQRPMSWRQQILKLYPNGMAPLTAIMSMMGGKKVTDPQFHWWTQTQTTVGGDVAGIFTDAAATVAYAPGAFAAAGDTLYVTVSTADFGQRIREGHQILLRMDTDWRVDKQGKVTNVNRGALVTIIAVRLLEDDAATAAPIHDLSDATDFKIIGNINAEGAEMPDAIALIPTKMYNFTQIMRTALSSTRTALETTLRTGDDYQKAKAEALEMHSWEMELAAIWGIKTENTGDNGKPERTTGGLMEFIKTYAAANCDDYKLNATYSGQTWAAGGELWLDTMLELIFRYGAQEKLCLCGSGFLLGIDALAKAGGQMNIAPGQKFYGMEVDEWRTVFGKIKMKTHPLFSFDETTRNMAIILEPKELGFRYITDTTFYGESSAKVHPAGYGQRRVDGLNEEYLTEWGIEFALPQKCAILNGVGQANIV